MTGKRPITVGVLALQGAFAEHIKTLQKLGVHTLEVKLPEHFEQIDAIILPGGESTTMAYLLDTFNLRGPLQKKVKNGMPVWGTCAGMILLAKELKDDRPTPLRVMDIKVARNAFGRQIDSFEGDLDITKIGKEPVHIVFIRAPVILEAGKSVEILATLPDGTIIAAQEQNMLATAFHPELTNDLRFHEYFLTLIGK